MKPDFLYSKNLVNMICFLQFHQLKSKGTELSQSELTTLTAEGITEIDKVEEIVARYKFCMLNGPLADT